MGIELFPRPPTDLVHVLRAKHVPGELRRRLVALGLYQVDPLPLARISIEVEPVRSAPDPRAELDFAASRLPPATPGRSPPRRSHPPRCRRPGGPKPSSPGTRNARAGSVRPGPGRARAPLAERQSAGPGRQLLEPAQPLVVWHRRVRRRRGRQDEEPRLAEPPLLHAELRPLAERPAVRLLAHEPDPGRVELLRQRREPLGRALEVGAPQVARAGRRPVGGVRQPEAERRQLELLGRGVQARRESGVVKQTPEVVARIGEVGGGRVGPPARVDPAEDHVQVGREDIRDAARRRLRARFLVRGHPDATQTGA